MVLITSTSQSSIDALSLVTGLQDRFVSKSNQVTTACGFKTLFQPVEWLRDDGVHGGGVRFEGASNGIFNTASINISQVQYEDLPEKKLAAATALSAIIHPDHPIAPSIHIHISWTAFKDGQGYWRIMADLNPAIENQADTNCFVATLKKVSGQYYNEATTQGDYYFYIPSLKCYRGVSHFYLEAFTSGNNADDIALANRFGEDIIDCYCEILSKNITQATNPNNEQLNLQLDYHTLYFYQVVTLDRGTTSGLLVHDQNDVGVLGSLPAYIDCELLASWLSCTPEPQNKLIENILALFPDEDICEVTNEIKSKIANVIRNHYKTYPKAITLQATVFSKKE